jgi:polyhydroxybutyrate depolymerase
MAQVAACQMADRITAVVSVSGALDDGLPCHPSRPVSLLEIHGTADSFVVYAYGQQAVAAWRSFDGCNTASSTTTRAPFTFTSWNSCEAGSTVELITNDGGPHAWPLAGSAMVWAFVSSHLNDSAA